MDERRFEMDPSRGGAWWTDVDYWDLPDRDGPNPVAGYIVMKWQHGNDCPCYYCTYHMKTSKCIPSADNRKFISWFNFWWMMENILGLRRDKD